MWKKKEKTGASDDLLLFLALQKWDISPSESVHSENTYRCSVACSQFHMGCAASLPEPLPRKFCTWSPSLLWPSQIRLHPSSPCVQSACSISLKTELTTMCKCMFMWLLDWCLPSLSDCKLTRAGVFCLPMGNIHHGVLYYMLGTKKEFNRQLLNQMNDWGLNNHRTIWPLNYFSLKRG